MKTGKELEDMAYEMRKDVLRMEYHSGKKGAHLGGSLSAIELLAVLYGEIMHYNPKEPFWEGRDRFIMSKAHGAMALYAALKQAGFLSEADIAGALDGTSPYYEHPQRNEEKGIEISGGSLGQGLSLSVGMGLAMQKKRNGQSKIYVMLGDGECNEGAVWEAAASAIHFGLKQIVILVDVNGLQYGGPTEKILRAGSLKDRWSGMGFSVLETDGHNVRKIREALLFQTDAPKVILAHTVKGKGVSFAENRVEWHSAFLTEALYGQAMEELGACRK